MELYHPHVIDLIWSRIQWCSLVATSHDTQKQCVYTATSTPDTITPNHRRNISTINTYARIFLMNMTVLDDLASSGLLFSPIIKIHTKWNNGGFFFVPVPLITAARRRFSWTPRHAETTRTQLNLLILKIQRPKTAFNCHLGPVWGVTRVISYVNLITFSLKE